MTSTADAEARLFDALDRLARSDGRSQSTSLRMPQALHEALSAAVVLGLDGSFNAAVGSSIESVVRDFAKDVALSRHYEAFPEDRPSRAEVAAALVRGTADPRADRADLLVRAEEWLLAHDREATVDAVLALAHSWLDAVAA